MISYLYYAYVMGVYYEQAIALYQTGVIDTNGGVYTTDFGTKLTQEPDRYHDRRPLELRGADGGLHPGRYAQ